MKIISKIKKIAKTRTPVLVSAYRAWQGDKEVKRVKKKYGKDTHVFLMRGATGDTYIQLMIYKNFVREKQIGSYILMGDSSGIKNIRKLFPMTNYEYISGYKADCVEKAYMLLGGDYLDLTIMFPWNYNLYANRCRVRMIDRFNFMDTYKWYVLNLKGEMLLEKPVFKTKNKDFIFDMEKRGIIQGKTVIISPDANSVTCLPVEFWNDIIGKLKVKGYYVFMNCNYCSQYKAPDTFFSYEESVPLLEYAGYFIGVRSGLCDIISTAKCKKIILYPQKAEKVNYSEHRSEIEFSGFKVMHLVEENDKDTIEISTPLIRNITQIESGIDSIDDYYKKISCLSDNILNNFSGEEINYADIKE